MDSSAQVNKIARFPDKDSTHATCSYVFSRRMPLFRIGLQAEMEMGQGIKLGPLSKCTWKAGRTGSSVECMEASIWVRV